MPAAHLFPRILPDCKQVCIVPASSYIRLRFACRIYCGASAEQTVVLSCDILRYKCACGTPVSKNPARLQTGLHRAGFFVYSASLCLPHILWRLGRAVSVACPHPIWRYTVALRHPQLQEAIAIANKFAPLRLLTSVTSFFISPNSVMQINLLCSRLLRIFVRFCDFA